MNESLLDWAAIVGMVAVAGFLWKLSKDVSALRAEVAKDIGQLQTEIAKDIGQLQTELAKEVGNLGQRISRIEGSLFHPPAERNAPKSS